MKQKGYEANFRVKGMALLQDVESLSRFLEQVIAIRKLFGFTKEVILEEVPNLKKMEQVAGGPLPSWVIGLSAGRNIWILKKSEWKNQKMGFSELILHEFVHIAINYSVTKRIPVWMNEGFAVYLSGQYKDYKLHESHIRAEVDFYHLSYESENLYIIAAKAVTALVKRYGKEVVIREMIECEDLQKSKIFCNENLNRTVQEKE